MKSLFLLVLLGLIWNCHAWGDDPVLPGSKVSTAKAVRDGDAFFVGEIISVSPSTSGSVPGRNYESKVKLIRGIHGALSVMNTGIPVLFTLGDGETMPQSGQSYIFCVSGNAQRGFRFMRLLSS